MARRGRPPKHETEPEQMTVIDLDKVKAIVTDMFDSLLVGRTECDSFGHDYAKAIGYLTRCIVDLMAELHMKR